MLKKKLLAVALVGACALPGAVFAEEPASPHTLTGNVMLTSDYVFRGISQTNEDAAVQGGFDYAHGPTGLYAGTWASSVGFGEAGLEQDIYAGWAKTWGDFGLNIGAIHYDYPGLSVLNTDEVYVAGTWKWFTLKYSNAISDRFFGVLDGKNSAYAELNFAYTFPGDWILGAHYGTTMFDGTEPTTGADNSDFDYDDYKVSIAKVYAGLTLALAYVGTQDADAYAAFTQASNPDIGDDRVVFSVSKTF
ncbi:MAG: hypothetical protein H7X76_00865 [Prolixibacteraceae bacterium]|nr:hypothetical protein [Burkholderiales bacterium]